MAKVEYWEDGKVIEVEDDDPRLPENCGGDESTIISDEERAIVTAECNRVMRNNELGHTDWWGVSDRTMSDAEKKYRQDLRDLPTHSKWPNLEDSDWPTKPS